MIGQITGTLLQCDDQQILINVGGLGYEVHVPQFVCDQIRSETQLGTDITLVTYYYLQISPSTGIPILIGFLSTEERDFFQGFIKVSGIGPRAAVRALNKPIGIIVQAINDGDLVLLTSLPGIGKQRAKEIVAKLQGKVQAPTSERGGVSTPAPNVDMSSKWIDDALNVLLQLQYRKSEAELMIQKTIERNKDIQSTEDLLNEIYSHSL